MQTRNVLVMTRRRIGLNQLIGPLTRKEGKDNVGEWRFFMPPESLKACNGCDVSDCVGKIEDISTFTATWNGRDAHMVPTEIHQSLSTFRGDEEGRMNLRDKKIPHFHLVVVDIADYGCVVVLPRSKQIYIDPHALMRLSVILGKPVITRPAEFGPVARFITGEKMTTEDHRIVYGIPSINTLRPEPLSEAEMIHRIPIQGLTPCFESAISRT